MWLRALGIVILAVGCKKDEDPGDTDPIDANDGNNDGCGDNPPTIEALAVEPAGLSTGDECGGPVYPLISIGFNGEDVDGDLHYWTLRVWYDDVIDGAVDTSTAYREVFSTVREPCEVDNLNGAMRMCVTGAPPFETELEFGAVLLDNLEHESGEPVIAVFTTPDDQGNYE